MKIAILTTDNREQGSGLGLLIAKIVGFGLNGVR